MEHTEKRPDRRVVKTKKAIRNAFAKLLSEKELDKITMKDIAEEANINRKTLYNYYGGIYQLVDEIGDEVISAFDEAMRDVDFRRAMSEPSTFFRRLTEILLRDMEFYGHLLSMSGNVSLANKIADTVKLKARQAVMNQLNADEGVVDVAVDYSVTGMMTVYKSWFNSGRKVSIEELSEIVRQICIYGVSSVLGN